MRSPFFLRRQASSRRRFLTSRFQVEVLEDRNTPYAITGDAWPHPEMISISIVPDGTLLGYNGGTPIYSNLIAQFNADMGSQDIWQDEILRAAQVWAQQTNINFKLMSDNGTASGGGNYQQGDPGMGDLRIAGYSMGGNLAGAYLPPPDTNYSLAGDIFFNTSYTFEATGGSGYDVFTVASHEIGHALGMDHSAVSAATMYASYLYEKSALNADDKSGIRAITAYSGARDPDSYDGGAGNDTFANASTVSINSTTKWGQVASADIYLTSDVDFYKVYAPSGHNGSLVVTVQSAGLSLLHPKVYVYDLWQNQIGYATGYGNYGTTVTVTVSSGIVAGRHYFVKVMGADSSAFGTGKYGVNFKFGTTNPSAIPLPNTTTAEGSPNVTGGLHPLETVSLPYFGSATFLTANTPFSRRVIQAERSTSMATIRVDLPTRNFAAAHHAAFAALAQGGYGESEALDVETMDDGELLEEAADCRRD